MQLYIQNNFLISFDYHISNEAGLSCLVAYTTLLRGEKV